MGNSPLTAWCPIGIGARSTEANVAETKKLMDIGLRQAQTKVNDTEHAISVLLEELDAAAIRPNTKTQRLAIFKKLKEKKKELQRNKDILEKEQLESMLLGRLVDNKIDMKRQKRLVDLKRKLNLFDSGEIRQHTQVRVREHKDTAEVIHSIDMGHEMEEDVSTMMMEETDVEEERNTQKSEKTLSLEKELEQYDQQRMMTLVDELTIPDHVVEMSSSSTHESKRGGVKAVGVDQSLLKADHLIMELENVN